MKNSIFSSDIGLSLNDIIDQGDLDILSSYYIMKSGDSQFN